MYTYEKLSDDIAYLKYNGVDAGTIGNSTLGYPIPYIHAGEYSGRQIIVTGGIHARENITSLLVARLAFNTVFTPNSFDGGIYFLPMLNPDGALLIEKGVDIVPDFDKRGELLKINGSNDFSLWKANINGVDLNNNFDARFKEDLRLKDAPSPQGYPGKYPFCQKETNLLKLFTLSVCPCATLSYHALGREVYYNFFQDAKSLERDYSIAQALAKKLDYKLIDSDLGSTGGYKDWCIDKLMIPAFTIEIISDKHPHPLDLALLDEDWEQNKDIPQLLLSLL